MLELAGDCGTLGEAERLLELEDSHVRCSDSSPDSPASLPQTIDGIRDGKVFLRKISPGPAEYNWSGLGLIQTCGRDQDLELIEDKVATRRPTRALLTRQARVRQHLQANAG